MPEPRLSVVVTRRLPEAVETRMSELFDVTLRPDDVPMTREALAAAMRGADVLVPTITDEIDAALLAQAGDRLKLIANFGAGVDNIDVQTARQRGIHVSNTPGVLTEDTADMTMALILAVRRRIPEGLSIMQKGDWEGWAPTGNLGHRVGGQRLGVLGMGRIGQAVARRCQHGFGMKVCYANPSEKVLDIDAERRPIEDVLKVADFVVLCVPASAETRHMINAEALALMQPHARLINVARGDVVDELALIDALQKGVIGGAGLDVFENEPDVPEALRAMENVVLLPHLGTAALEVREAMGLMALKNLRTFLDGDTPPNLVN